MQTFEHAGETSRQVFVSYAREDLQRVVALRTGLQRLQHQVWIDDRLALGQAWWDEILQQIRRCDAVVVAVSPALLKSQASALERTYAHRLGKRILPVCVRQVSTQLLPPDLARLQFVDYSDPGADAAFQLAYALNGLPPSPPLPDPLPDPPPVPVSYLSSLGEQVNATTLTLDEQFAIVARLQDALAEPEEREAARQLLLTMQRRVDLYHAPARQIDQVLAQAHRVADATPSSASRPVARPGPPSPDGDPPAPGSTSDGRRPAAAASTRPGWYPDPTGRHRLRWFDGDWSDWASNGQVVVPDSL